MVVLTLTTIPSRLHDTIELGIKSCIQSLLNQSFSGYEIHFNIPYTNKHLKEDYIIPEWLKQLEVIHSSKLFVFRTEDYGPITKIVPTLKRIKDPETIIITVDDDLVYHPDMVSEQVNNQTKFPGCVVGYDGMRALVPTFNDIRDYYVVSVPQVVEVKILQHYKTVSYKRKYFDDDFFTDFVGMNWADDVVVSSYICKQKIKKYVATYEHEPKLMTIEEWQNRGGVTTFPVLRHTNHETVEGCFHFREIERTIPSHAELYKYIDSYPN